MQITLAYAVSVNGKITRGDDPNVHGWTSDEDGEHFQQLKQANEVIIIDRKTYEAVQPSPEVGTLRIVFTSTPGKFSDKVMADQLEFVSVTSRELVDQLKARGYTTALLAGGSRLSKDFLAANLVDEIYVTFEPWLFASGQPMLAEAELAIKLQLVSIRQLNNHGSLLAHYTVLKNS